jgi:hypothetical protein
MGLIAAVAAGLVASSATPALAWRARVFVGPGIVVGPPVLVGPPVVVAPSYPAPVVVEPAPVHQEQPQTAARQYWYYCQDPAGYYPYVKECPRGWQPVSPTPSAP